MHLLPSKAHPKASTLPPYGGQQERHGHFSVVEPSIVAVSEARAVVPFGRCAASPDVSLIFSTIKNHL